MWRRLCLALPSSLSRFLLLVERLHGKMPRMSIQTFPTRPRLCFRPFEAYSKVRLCVICHVCLYRWHPQFTARTARCSERPAQTRWTRSTHWTLPYRPSGARLWCPLELVLLVNRHFCTQLAPQQISSFLGASAELQEQHGALC